jgi:hypothetical protein
MERLTGDPKDSHVSIRLGAEKNGDENDDDTSAMESDLWAVAADISNAFLDGKNIDKTMIKAGPEFGWYDHKTAAASVQAHIAAKLKGKWVWYHARQTGICGSGKCKKCHIFINTSRRVP